MKQNWDALPLMMKKRNGFPFPFSIFIHNEYILAVGPLWQCPAKAFVHSFVNINAFEEEEY